MEQFRFGTWARAAVPNGDAPEADLACIGWRVRCKCSRQNLKTFSLHLVSSEQFTEPCIRLAGQLNLLPDVASVSLAIRLQFARHAASHATSHGTDFSGAGAQ